MAVDQEQEDLPVNIVSPAEFNIDPSTTRFAPLEFSGMAAQGLANWYGANVVPAVESIGNYWHQAMLPGGEQYDPATDPEHEMNKPAKESEPLLQAIESGYADKKLMKPLDEIRQGIATGDYDAIGKAHRKMVDALTGNMSWGEKFADHYLREGKIANAHKMAADVIMNEVLRQPTRAVEATQAGLMQPSELLPEQQLPVFEHMIPSQSYETGLGPEFRIDNPPSVSVQPSLMPAQPGQAPSTAIVDPSARLTPMQESLIEARTKAQASPRTGAGPKSMTPSDIAMRGIETAIRAKEELLGRPLTAAEKVPIIERGQGLLLKEAEQQSKNALRKAQIDLAVQTGNMRDAYRMRAIADAEQAIPARAYALNRLGDLREVQMDLMDAQADWYRQLPTLRRELAGAPAFETEAIKRVHDAISKKQPIDRGDWLIVERWLRKGSPRFTMDFMGRAFDRLSGQKAEAGKPFGWLGLPEPPDTTFDETTSNVFQETDKDLLTRFSEFLGSLLGLGGPKEPEQGTRENPYTPKTPEEASKLKPGSYYKTPDGKVMVR